MIHITNAHLIALANAGATLQQVAQYVAACEHVPAAYKGLKLSVEAMVQDFKAYLEIVG